MTSRWCLGEHRVFAFLLRISEKVQIQSWREMNGLNISDDRECETFGVCENMSIEGFMKRSKSIQRLELCVGSGSYTGLVPANVKYEVRRLIPLM